MLLRVGIKTHGIYRWVITCVDGFGPLCKVYIYIYCDIHFRALRVLSASFLIHTSSTEFPGTWLWGSEGMLLLHQNVGPYIMSRFFFSNPYLLFQLRPFLFPKKYDSYIKGLCDLRQAASLPRHFLRPRFCCLQHLYKWCPLTLGWLTSVTQAHAACGFDSLIWIGMNYRLITSDFRALLNNHQRVISKGF